MNRSYKTKVCTYIIPILFFILSAPLQTFAQYTIKGQVTDSKTGQPLNGVHVYIHGIKKGTVTNQNGQYRISQLPKGSLSIQFSYLGYTNVSKDVQLNQEHTVSLNITLKPTTYQTNQIVVLGNRIQNQHTYPQPTDVLSQQSITMSSHSTVWKTLAQTPGIARISNGPGIERPVIRGISSNGILILNQNMPYNYQKWDPESGLSLSGNGTEQVQVIKGPATLMYGQGAMGGVINLIGEHPAPVGQTNGGYTLKAFNNTAGINNSLSLKGSQAGYFWGFRGGFDSNADYTAGNGEDVPNTRYNDVQLHGFAGITRSWGSTKITYQFHQHKNGIVDLKDLGQQDNGDQGKPRNIEKPYHKLTDNSVLSETHVAMGPGWMNVNLSFQNNEQQEFDAAPQNATAGKDAGIDLVLNTFNYQAKYDNPLTQNLHLHVGIQGDLQHNDSKGEEVFVPNADISDLGGFGLLTYKQNGLILQGGIRYDIRNLKSTSPEAGSVQSIRPVSEEVDRNFNNFSWSAGASYQITPFWNIKTNIGAGFRAPNLAELTAYGLLKEANRFEIGDNNLNPERNVEWDLGTNIDTDNMTFSVSAYYNWVHNYIYQELQSSKYQDPQSNDLYPIIQYRQHDAALWGGETSLSIHPQQLSWFQFTSAFDMVVGQLTNQAKTPLPMIPAHRWRNDIRLTAQHWGSLRDSYFAFGLSTYFKQNRTAALELKTSGYTLTHAQIGTSFLWGKQTVDVNLAVHNLFDVTYFSHLSWLRYDGIYNMGRNVSLTVHIPFGL